MHIGLAIRRERQRGRLSAIEQARIHRRIGMDLHRAIAPVVARDKAQRAALARRVKVLLLILGRDAAHVGLDPDLQQVRRAVRRMVELAVANTAARAHSLHVAGQDRRSVAHVVAVRERALEHVGDDLHVAVPVRAEAGTRRDPVFVDDAQVAEAHVRRVVVVGERKTVKALEPAMIGVAAFRRFAQGQHGRSPWVIHQCRTCSPKRQRRRVEACVQIR